MFLIHPTIFFWDMCILILLSLFLSGAIVCYIWVKRHPDHSIRKLILSFLGLLSFLCFLLITYGSFIEPHILVTTKHSIEHPLAHPVKIAVISDLHIGPYKGQKFIERVVKQTNDQVPDLILLVGDYVYTTTKDLSELSPLADLSAPLGVYAILGNHDVGQYQSLFGKRFSKKNHGDEIAGYLEQLDITVLRNENRVVTSTEGKIVIAGIDDMWTGRVDFRRALGNIPKGVFTILLSHNPSVIDQPEARRADLTVSGHTHGGQLRLPILGAMTGLPISIDQQYDQGVFELEDDRILAITRGAGESSPRARLFAWPEVMILELTSP